MHEYVRRFVFTCGLVSAEQKHEVDRHRAGASLHNIQPQMLHLSRKTSSKQNILLSNQSDSVSVSHLCRPRGINNLFGCGGKKREIKDCTNDPCEHPVLHLQLMSTDSGTAFTNQTVRGVLLELVKLQMMCLLAY